jgi:hypothetical protein
VRNRSATFFFRVCGFSMKSIGTLGNAILTAALEPPTVLRL